MAKKMTTKRKPAAKPKAKPKPRTKLDDTQNALRIFEQAIGGKLSGDTRSPGNVRKQKE